MIPFNRPFLPPQDTYLAYLAGIWDSKVLTNNGPLVRRLEDELKRYLQIKHIRILSNGTTALQLAIKALGLQGEIITTPFSFVATTSSIVWQGCRPVFVDINPDTWNIDPVEIESAITKDTVAILATHIFGNPCNIDAIAKIAHTHNLKVIYDAAQAFGVMVDNQSIYNFGDISATSFHSTKVFHTVEGGGVITQDKRLDFQLARMRNFGHAGPYKFEGIGINGKNSEFHAAMGLANLTCIENVLQRRKKWYQSYDRLLAAKGLQKQQLYRGSKYNYAYYPILVPPAISIERVIKVFKENRIEIKRYFYPLLSTLSYVSPQACPVAEEISSRIICLPLYTDMTQDIVDRVAEVLIKSLD